MELLPRTELIKTSKVDRAEWNFHPVLGLLQRTRFRLVLAMLAKTRYPRALEVGYGSGVFMPELKRYCDEIYGLDPHDKDQEVAAVLLRHGVTARLYSGSVTRMPFPDAFLDCIVAVSALEYVEDIDAACKEMRRVLRPGGVVVLVTPGESRLLDAALKLFTGEDAWENYGNRRRRLVPTLLRYFQREQEKHGPLGLGACLPIYTALRLRVPAE